MAQKLPNKIPEGKRPLPPPAPPLPAVAINEKQLLTGILTQILMVLNLMSSRYDTPENKRMIKELLDETRADILHLIKNG